MRKETQRGGEGQGEAGIKVSGATQSQAEGLGPKTRQSLRWGPGRSYPFLVFSNQ
jgi:hypothetical protein